MDVTAEDIGHPVKKPAVPEGRDDAHEGKKDAKGVPVYVREIGWRWMHKKGTHRRTEGRDAEHRLPADESKYALQEEG